MPSIKVTTPKDRSLYRISDVIGVSGPSSGRGRRGYGDEKRSSVILRDWSGPTNLPVSSEIGLRVWSPVNSFREDTSEVLRTPEETL